MSSGSIAFRCQVSRVRGQMTEDRLTMHNDVLCDSVLCPLSSVEEIREFY